MTTLYRFNTKTDAGDSIIFNQGFRITSINGMIGARDTDVENPGAQELSKPDTGLRGITLNLGFVLAQDSSVGDVDNFKKLLAWGVQEKAVIGQLKGRFGLTTENFTSWFDIDRPSEELGYKLTSVSLDETPENDRAITGSFTLEAVGKDIKNATSAGLKP